MKKDQAAPSSYDQFNNKNKNQLKSRTLYFDYENEWRVKTSTSPDL
jgi:hypothetical protein